MEAYEDVVLRQRLRKLADRHRNESPRRVYIFPALDCLKIGIAADPLSRWRDLRTGNPFLKPPLFVSSILVNARTAERTIHRNLRPYRVHGEWFNCTPDVALKTVTEVIAEWTAWEASDDRLGYGTAILRPDWLQR